MRKSLWIILAIMVVVIGAPAAMADTFTYSFVGSGYFAGTVVSFTTNGPAVLGTEYSADPGATDLFVLGTDEGPITGIEWALSPFVFSPCSVVCTVQMSLFSTLDVKDGPTIAGTSIPGPGTYGEYFGNGTLTITTTPEPATFAFTLSGLGLLGLILAMRKRTPVGHSQAS